MRKYLCVVALLLTFCACHGDYLPLGDGFFVGNGSVFYEFENGGNTFVIPPKMKRYGQNESYLIILQAIDTISWDEEEVEKTRFNPKFRYVKNVCEWRRQIAAGPCYWIIDKKKFDVFGPMNKHEYSSVCDSLSIKIMVNHY